ncbi:hypothetical protein LHYA1_G007686, partial [Lachnellula hyalina]
SNRGSYNVTEKRHSHHAKFRPVRRSTTSCCRRANSWGGMRFWGSRPCTILSTNRSGLALTSYVWNAASGGHADIVSYLLDNGAEIGASPLATTRRKDTDKAIRAFDVLFDHGLDLKTYRDGSELIHRVVNNEAFVKYLLLKGADPNGLEHWERTPLDCFCDNPASIMTLIDHGANIATGKPLHQAAVIVNDKDCIERMKLLVEHGVDVNVRAAYAGDAPHDCAEYKDGMRRTGKEERHSTGPCVAGPGLSKYPKSTCFPESNGC